MISIMNQNNNNNKREEKFSHKTILVSNLENKEMD